MKQLAAFIRRLLLFLTYISSLLLFLIGEISIGSLPLLNMVIMCGACYIIVCLISIGVRQIRKLRMDEDDNYRETLIDGVIYNTNVQLIHSLRRISFWGSLLFLVNAIIIHIRGGQVFGGTAVNDPFLVSYSRFLLWAIISYLVLLVISILYWIFYTVHVSGYSYTVFQYLKKLVVLDIQTPIRVIKNAININESQSKIKDILGLMIMLLFILYNAICLVRLFG